VRSPYYVPTPAAQLIFENVQQKEETKSLNLVERSPRRNYSVASNVLRPTLLAELDDKEIEICQPIESEYSIEANDKNQNFFSLKKSFVRPQISLNVPKNTYSDLLETHSNNYSPTNSTKASKNKMVYDNNRIHTFQKSKKLPFGVNMKIKAEM